MNKDIFKKIIIENQEFVQNIQLTHRKIPFELEGNIVLVGPRRTGKTFMLFQIIQDLVGNGFPAQNILYISFEDERLIGMDSSHLDLLLESYHELYHIQPLLCFDEIQIIPAWEKFVRRLADQKYKVYITGSNAQMLSRDIATTLGGRFLIHEILPLSFREYLSFNEQELSENWLYTQERFNVRKHFDNYFYFGGFPEISLFENKRSWLTSLFQKIYFGDLISRYAVRNDFALKMTIKKLAESVHDEMSFNRLRHIIQSAGVKMGTATVIEYLGYLADTWLIFRIENYEAKLNERESAQKTYFYDNGILGLFLHRPETILFENLVALALHKRYPDGIFYLKKQTELDFYNPSEGLMIQAAYQIDSGDTEKRETTALLKAEKQYSARQMQIITMDTEKTIESNGRIIQVIPLWRWLLDQG
jgi:uncharacterized protein